MRIINIGRSHMEVRITHMKKDVCYFLENIFGWKLPVWQKEILRETPGWPEDENTPLKERDNSPGMTTELHGHHYSFVVYDDIVEASCDPARVVEWYKKTRDLILGLDVKKSPEQPDQGTEEEKIKEPAYSGSQFDEVFEEPREPGGLVEVPCDENRHEQDRDGE